MPLRIRNISWLILALPVAGCASIPRSATSSAQIAQLDCASLASEHAQTQQTRNAAAEARRGAWKGVLPLVIGARYVFARSASTDADERIALVERHQQARACAPTEQSAPSITDTVTAAP